MKSLEIIDDLLFDFLDDAIDESATFISKGEIKQIKQDLEVLEILRKHLSNIYCCYGGELSFSEIRCIRLDDYNKANEEDYNKVKQWLEENR